MTRTDNDARNNPIPGDRVDGCHVLARDGDELTYLPRSVMEHITDRPFSQDFAYKVESSLESWRATAANAKVDRVQQLPADNPQAPDAVGIGANIRAHRVAAGLSQREVARRAGIDGSYLSLVESGRRFPSIPTLGAIAVAIGVHWAALLAPNTEATPCSP